MSRSMIEKILTLIKELPENTPPEDMDEAMYQLFAKKEITVEVLSEFDWKNSASRIISF